jgi:hypothetical protein
MRRTVLKFLASTPFLLTACGPRAPTPPDYVVGPKGPPSPEAAGRRARSEAVLKAEGVPLNTTNLPVLPMEHETRRRSVAEVAARTLALLAVAVKGAGLEQVIVDKIVRVYALSADFSPQEAAFIADPAPSPADQAKFGWRYEAAWALLWALSYVETLEKPTHPCHAATAERFLKTVSRAAFIAGAHLRPQSEILDQADLIYRYDWAVTHARAKHLPTPAGLNTDVVPERHQALNWLYGYADDAAWDDVTTDT